MVSKWPTAWRFALVLAMAGCGQVSFRLSGRPCNDGKCASGYECRPDTNICVPAIRRSCDGNGVCYEDVETGDPCETEDAYLPCGTGPDCADGCRSCVGGHWTACGFVDCVLGTLEHCTACGDDCRDRVLNAEPVCETNGLLPECAYVSCVDPGVDADQDPTNGCECIPEGTEVCDGQDNDCNGSIDDLAMGDLQTECGALYPSSVNVLTWICADTCTIGLCQAGFFDVDGLADNGCEADCAISNGGVETCDGLDNDCNGATDGMDPTLDQPAEVDADCAGQYPQATQVAHWSCVGSCDIQSCSVGYYHHDSDLTNGCEYPCVSSGTEICDGDDNDCDGNTDNLTAGQVQTDCNSRYPNVNVQVWSCTDGCLVFTCEPGFDDLDGFGFNGCESDCELTNNGLETCDGIDNDCNDAVDDVLDIGVDCGTQFPSAVDVQTWACVLGACDLTACVAGRADVDHLVSTGCEDACVATGTEICDDEDNDCNGPIDDVTQGALDTDCDARYPVGAPTVATWACVNGDCDVAACGPDSYDIDDSPANGCEYPCNFSGTEVCDGDDNDCDGATDTADTDLNQQTEINADCGAQHAPCTDVVAWGCSAGVCDILQCAPNTHHNDTNLENGCEYPCTISGAEICDGDDNDCDGLFDANDSDLDEAAELKLDCEAQYPLAEFVDIWECTTGSCTIQACLGNHYYYDGNVATGCEYPCVNNGAETCDNYDNDCDGTIDNATVVSNCWCADGLHPPQPAEVCWDGVDDDCNEAIDDGCGCSPAHTFTISTETTSCPGGTIEVPVMHLRLDTDCDNSLTSLTLTRHPASDTQDGELSNLRLLEDVDNSGSLTGGDLFLAGGGSMSSGQITFSGFDLPVVSGTPRYLVVVADAAATSYFAAQLTDPSSFGLSDTNQTNALGTTPLVGGAHSMVTAVVCPGLDLGLTTRPAASAQQVTGPGNTSWAQGSGDESGWATGSLVTGPLSDCDLSTAGDLSTQTWDQGETTRFLHLDTGVPLGLPICRLTMRVHATNYGLGPPTRCEFELIQDHASVWLYPYTSATQVAAGSPAVQTTAGAQSGTLVVSCNGDPPATDYLDLDLTALYAAGVGTGSFSVRFIPEGGSDPDVNDDTQIKSIAEVYLLLDTP